MKIELLSSMLLTKKSDLISRSLEDLLKGGFAPTVTLLREFHYDKTGIVLDGLPYSTWSLLEHMRHRQHVLLLFMKEPLNNQEIWPEAFWGQKTASDNQQEWNEAIAGFENELQEMINIVQTQKDQLFEIQNNGKTFYEAAQINLHHNAYHIGQVKAIGRQLGVW